MGKYQGMIEPLRIQNAELRLTIKKLKHLVGDDELEFVEAETQTVTEVRENYCQTKQVRIAHQGV